MPKTPRTPRAVLLNDGPEILCGRTTAPLAPAAAQYAKYDSSRLTWNKPHTRNNENKYSYSGSCRPAGQGPALRCTSCKNFFFLVELGDGLLTPGFLPHQRNYKFTCGAPPPPHRPRPCLVSHPVRVCAQVGAARVSRSSS